MHTIPDYDEGGCRSLSKLETRRAARRQRKWMKKVKKYGYFNLLMEHLKLQTEVQHV